MAVIVHLSKTIIHHTFSQTSKTSGDIHVLTHEAGHAFQVYSSRDIGIPEYLWPTYEVMLKFTQ